MTEISIIPPSPEYIEPETVFKGGGFSLDKIRNHKKLLGAGLAVLLVLIAGVTLLTKGGTDVEFTVLAEEEYPGQIVSQVIPEYRKLERALACVVDDTVYVVATRGEKASDGYEIAIDKMTLVEEDGAATLEVYVKFTDPSPDTAVGQAVTYPLQVAKTDLKELPNHISLKVEYVD